MGADGSGDASRSVVERVFRVLQAFDAERSELTLAELTVRTGLPKTTLHRMAGQLVEAGVLESTERGYQLGMMLFELGGLVPRQRRLREVALPFIEDLYEATRHTIHFGVLNGTDVLYIERIRGHNDVAVATRLGGRVPAYCTGLGKAMLAFSSPEMVQRTIERGLEPRTPSTITRPQMLRRVLEKVAIEGVAYDREESQIGISCVAAPVLNRAGYPTAAISATTTPDRIAWKQLTYAVKTTALGLSREVRRMPDSYWDRSESAVQLHA